MEINSAGETKKKNPKQINHDLNVHTKFHLSMHHRHLGTIKLIRMKYDYSILRELLKE